VVTKNLQKNVTQSEFFLHLDLKSEGGYGCYSQALHSIVNMYHCLPNPCSLYW